MYKEQYEALRKTVQERALQQEALQAEMATMKGEL